MQFSRLPLLLATAMLVFGCSPELASFDDTYESQSVDENFPIKVVEQPVRLMLQVPTGGMRARDREQVLGFGRKAAARATTPVTVSYASGSKLAKQAAGEAARLLVREGVPAHAVLVTPRDGRTNEVTLVFATKRAQTKPCGNWNENLRANQFNDSGPNFGCAFQQNFAAMVANPEDLETPQVRDQATSAAQKPALDTYESGEWQEPVDDNTLSSF